jgi:murein DD-endopeptidase MepM/ murein hydrolase activator NlpD
MKKAAGMILLLAWGLGGAWVWASPPPEQESEIAALARQKSEEAENLLRRLDSLRQISLRTRKQIDFLQAQMEKLRKSAAALDREISSLTFQTGELVKTLRSRLADMYKYNAQEESLLVFFATRNIHEALDLAYLIGRFARRDQRIVDDLLVKTAMLGRAELGLRRTRAQLAALSEALSDKRAQYEAAAAATKSLLASVQRERRSAETADASEQVGRSLDRIVLALLEKKKTLAAMEREAGIESAGGGAPALARGALLDWPLKGPVAVPYGPRVHAVFKTEIFNTGIDIRAASGAAVGTAGPGEVLFGGKLPGLGYAVVVEHGWGIVTVYAHLSSVRVRERDAVRSGTLLGAVGDTWGMGGFGFHFEVRVDGVPKNPLDYLKKL